MVFLTYKLFLIFSAVFLLMESQAFAQQGLSFEKAYDTGGNWKNKRFISVESPMQGIVNDVTIYEDTAKAAMQVSQRYFSSFVSVPRSEFVCLEKIYRHSLYQAKGLVEEPKIQNLLFAFYFHTSPPYTEELILDKRALVWFFNSLIDEMDCTGNCLPIETKNKLTSLIREQLKWVK